MDKKSKTKTLKEACGIFACSFERKTDLNNHLEKGLKALQHRGEDGAGLAFIGSNDRLKAFKTAGLVPDLIETLGHDCIRGFEAIGHVRYGTCGRNDEDLVQPLVKPNLNVAIAFNGQIDAKGLASDTERLLETFLSLAKNCEFSITEKNNFDLVENLTKASKKEAFSVVALYEKKVYAYRDANGTRPLFMANIGQNEPRGLVLASETCAFNHLDVSEIQEIAPGTLIVLEKGKVIFRQEARKVKKQFCAFEALYFSREDSRFCENVTYYDVRKTLGRTLADADKLRDTLKYDVVVGVPQSGMPAALGYAQESKHPLEFGLIKSRYEGRSFIQPSELERKQVLEEKLHVQASIISGKHVLLVDDTLVRGHTMKHLVKILKRAGAKSVHVRIAAPPIVSPCSKGVDTGRETSLPASALSQEALRDHIGAESLEFLTLEMLKSVIGRDICQACFIMR